MDKNCGRKLFRCCTYCPSVDQNRTGTGRYCTVLLLDYFRATKNSFAHPSNSTTDRPSFAEFAEGMKESQTIEAKKHCLSNVECPITFKIQNPNIHHRNLYFLIHSIQFDSIRFDSKMDARSHTIRNWKCRTVSFFTSANSYQNSRTLSSWKRRRHIVAYDQIRRWFLTTCNSQLGCWKNPSAVFTIFT